jgi:hypothetical protein
MSKLWTLLLIAWGRLSERSERSLTRAAWLAQATWAPGRRPLARLCCCCYGHRPGRRLVAGTVTIGLWTYDIRCAQARKNDLQ